MNALGRLGGGNETLRENDQNQNSHRDGLRTLWTMSAFHEQSRHFVPLIRFVAKELRRSIAAFVASLGEGVGEGKIHLHGKIAKTGRLRALSTEGKWQRCRRGISWWQMMSTCCGYVATPQNPNATNCLNRVLLIAGGHISFGMLFCGLLACAARVRLMQCSAQATAREERRTTRGKGDGCWYY